MSAPVASDTRTPLRASRVDQRVLGRRPEPGADQERAELVAIQGSSMGLVVQPRAADMSGRGVLEEFFLDGVLIEPGDGA